MHRWFSVLLLAACLPLAGCGSDSKGDGDRAGSVKPVGGSQDSDQKQDLDIKVPGVHIKIGGGKGVDVRAPGVNVKAGQQGVEVEAPGVNVKTDQQGVDVKAPGVNVKTGP